MYVADVTSSAANDDDDDADRLMTDCGVAGGPPGGPWELAARITQQTSSQTLTGPLRSLFKLPRRDYNSTPEACSVAKQFG